MAKWYQKIIKRLNLVLELIIQTSSRVTSSTIGFLKNSLDELKRRFHLAWTNILGIPNRILEYQSLRRKPLLSHHIKHSKAIALKGKYKPYKPRMKLYQPSYKSFFSILSFFVAVFIVSHWSDWSAVLPDSFSDKFLGWGGINTFVTSDQGHYQNLIAVLAGIGAIVFALMIFIAESFRDGSPDKGRVLLKESLIWPLTVSLIFTFLMFLWGDHNHLIIVPIVLVALLTIYSLGRVISILINRVKFTEKRLQFLKETILRSVNLAVESRLADNILLSKLQDDSFPLEYSLVSISSTGDFKYLKTSKYGQIRDINLLKLEQFAKKLEKAAIKNGYSYWPSSEKVEQALTANAHVSESQSKQLEQNTKRYLLKRYNEIVDENQSTLICYDSKLTDGNKSIQEELSRLVDEIFIIGKPENFSDEARSEIENVRDAFSKAINNKAIGEVKEYSHTFIALAEGFLDEVSKFSGGYSYDQARNERTSLLSGWAEVKWLTSDLQELLKMAIDTNNTDIIKIVAYTPIAIARRAMGKGDHYIFQEFIRFSELLYTLAINLKDSDLKDYLVDRSWRYMNELCRFHVVYSLQKEDIDLDKIRSYRGFSIFFLQVYQNLLRLSFEHEDLQSFKQYVNEVGNLFSDFKVHRRAHEIRGLEYQLRNTEDEKNKKILNEKLSVVEGREDLIKEVDSKKFEMLFGVSAFVLDKYINNREDERLRLFYSSIISSLPDNLSSLTSLFYECHTFEAEDFWNWNWWDMKPDGGIQEIQVLEKLEVLFVVRSLQILSSLDQDQIDGISLPPSRDLVFLVDGSRVLMSTLNDIENNPDHWDVFVDQVSRGKVEAFRKLLNNAKSRQEELEIDKKINTPISQSKVEKFEADVVASFNDRQHLISIFSHYNCYKNNSQKLPYPNMVNRLGINTVDDKAAFFDDWFVHFGDYGESYGMNIASGIESVILSQIIENSSTLDFRELDSYLDSIEDLNDIFILYTDVQAEQVFDDSGRFIPHWHSDIGSVKEQNIAGYYGCYKHRGKLIPVFEVFDPESASQLLVINASNFATFVQDPPVEKGESFDKVKDIFYIDIATFSESDELLEELISSSPEWLQKIGDRDAQIRHLIQSVIIKIFVRFHFEWHASVDIKSIIIEEDIS